MALVCVALVSLVIRGPRLIEDARYAVEGSWPLGEELRIGSDGAIDVAGRKVVVAAGMAVDCTPAVVPVPIPWDPCKGPGLGASLREAISEAVPDLPAFVHVRVESKGRSWESAMREIERGYDRAQSDWYLSAAATRAAPDWRAGDAIAVVVWIDAGSHRYSARLPPSTIHRVE